MAARLHVTAEPAIRARKLEIYRPDADGTSREFTFYMEAKSIITRLRGHG